MDNFLCVCRARRDDFYCGRIAHVEYQWSQWTYRQTWIENHELIEFKSQRLCTQFADLNRSPRNFNINFKSFTISFMNHVSSRPSRNLSNLLTHNLDRHRWASQLDLAFLFRALFCDQINFREKTAHFRRSEIISSPRVKINVCR